MTNMEGNYTNLRLEGNKRDYDWYKVGSTVLIMYCFILQRKHYKNIS